MTSSDEKAGRALLHKWKTTEDWIGVSLDSIGSALVLTGVGAIAELGEDALRFEGEGFNFFLKLKDAGFDNVVSEALLSASGLDPTKYVESLEILLDTGDKLVFWHLRQEVAKPS